MSNFSSSFDVDPTFGRCSMNRWLNGPPVATSSCTPNAGANSSLKHLSPRCIGANLDSSAAVTKVEETDNIDAMEDEETPAEVAALLASVASIATMEIENDPPIMKELAELAFPDLSRSFSREDNDVEGLTHMECDWQSCNQNQKPLPLSQIGLLKPIIDLHQKSKKMRSVSVDSPDIQGIEEPNLFEEEAVPTLLQWRSISNNCTHVGGIFSTPPPSPRIEKQQNHCIMSSGQSNSIHHPSNEKIVFKSIAESVKLDKSRRYAGSIPENNVHGHPVRHHCEIKSNKLDVPALEKTMSEVDDKPKKLILRKKFSWKNYPELEEFLITNREEYLRHSTLNYTMQQKKYNNCLTHRLIQLASSHGYEFDPHEFSFVTVRDRIRCYFKSYVQSMKKRGVVIGYAARRAGLVTEEELEESAMRSGKIYVPIHERD